MSLTIRLARIGRKNQPAYKLVVSNTRDKRNGKYLDILGYFNPFDPEKKFSYDKEKFEKWKKNGALVTEAVTKLIENKYQYIEYSPKKTKDKKETKKAEIETEAVGNVTEEEKSEGKEEKSKEEEVEKEEVEKEKTEEESKWKNF